MVIGKGTSQKTIQIYHELLILKSGLDLSQFKLKEKIRISKLESLISQTYNGLASNNPKKDFMVETKQ